MKEYTKAACAAYTYYLKHPHDQNAQRNVQMYREKMEVKDEEFVDLDRKSYQVKVTNISFQYLIVLICVLLSLYLEIFLVFQFMNA